MTLYGKPMPLGKRDMAETGPAQSICAISIKWRGIVAPIGTLSAEFRKAIVLKGDASKKFIIP
jgi:hypothetical protein